jgi:hypothetical protein
VQILENNDKRINKLIQELSKGRGDAKVPRQEVIRYLLEYSLRAYQKSKFTLDGTLEVTGLTLYPEEARAVPKRKRKRKLIRRTLRWIPTEVWNPIKELAAPISPYPLWQVHNRFLEYALDQYETGKLKIPVYEKTTQVTLYT